MPLRALACCLGVVLVGCSLHQGVYRVDYDWPPRVMRLRVGGLLERNGRYLVDVAPGNPPSVELFGGGVEAGESPREALVREWREELGVTPEVGALRAVVQRFFEFGGARVSQLDLVFEVRLPPTARIAVEDGRRPHWFTPAEFARVRPLPGILFASLPITDGVVYLEEERL